MAYGTEDARRDMLDDIARATDRISEGLAAVGAAYEQLDEQTADRLEEALFRPLQLAYGRARRTHAGFAARHGLPGREFSPAGAGRASQGVRGFLDAAVEAITDADDGLAELQDSMRPVEVGDAELRAGLAEVREILGPLPERTHELLRRFGR